jgi:hypothetical protein
MLPIDHTEVGLSIYKRQTDPETSKLQAWAFMPRSAQPEKHSWVGLKEAHRSETPDIVDLQQSSTRSREEQNDAGEE